MRVLVDTSVWSLALRRDKPASSGESDKLRQLLDSGGAVFTTGIILQELLQGFAGPRARRDILDRFQALPAIVPDQQDHIAAADLRNHCRRHGIQTGTIDALIAQLAIHHDLHLLTTDDDFRLIAGRSDLRILRP